MLDIIQASGESTESVQSGIEALLSQCDSIEYFEHPALVHGVYSPLHRSMVTEDEADQKKGEQIEGITGLSFTNKSNLTGDGFRHIAYLTSLQRLFLSNSSLADSQVVHLGKLHHLRVLYLSETQITDAGMAHLKGLTKLKALDVSRTKVSDTGLKDLRTSLPGTQITPSRIAQ